MAAARLDLGRIDGPLLVFGGPYSNLPATRALRAEAGCLGLPAERCLCTGDVVAYCADPAGTVAELRDWGVPVVMGNCEESLAAGAADCGCGFAEGTACDRLSKQWFDYASARLGTDERRWMGALPRRIDFTLGGRRWAAIHGGTREINRFVFASQADGLFVEELDAAGVDAVVAGHCGLPFIRPLGDRLWVNAGVVGMPANDGTADGWYALLEPLDGGVAVNLRRLPYDAAEAARRLRVEGLNGGYAAALETGLWPSLDVLPAAERQRTGEAIHPEPFTWRTRGAARQPRCRAAAQASIQ